jgi:hypothetical protein
MDSEPKTRRESKKTAKEKKEGGSVYSSKHVRQLEKPSSKKQK